MTITYPLTFPTVLKLKTVVPTLQFINAVSRSPYTLERQAFKWPGEAWMFDYTTPPCERDVAEEWIAFAAKLRGTYGTFLIGDASAETPRGVATGSPLVKGASQEGYSLNIDGATANVTGWLLKGTYIQLGTGLNAHLHKLVEDANTDSGGNATLELVPILREPPADNSAVIITAAKGLFVLESNAVTWSADENGHYRYNFKAIEAL